MVLWHLHSSTSSFSTEVEHTATPATVSWYSEPFIAGTVSRDSCNSLADELEPHRCSLVRKQRHHVASRIADWGSLGAMDRTRRSTVTEDTLRTLIFVKDSNLCCDRNPAIVYEAKRLIYQFIAIYKSTDAPSTMSINDLSKACEEDGIQQRRDIEWHEPRILSSEAAEDLWFTAQNPILARMG